MDRVRFGILSTAKIGIEKVIPAMQQGHLCEVTAICSRTPDRAEKVAEQLDIPTAYGSYEELLSDPTVDAIYNPLPNHLHVPWTLKALEAASIPSAKNRSVSLPMKPNSWPTKALPTGI
ncbi:Gfo/Idh/MocA family protein [Halalkalibaculum sp. DA384]|uniref:Gfo/Idh/MocA family protein n=1 Tax=Halalkalibaculum sp. DA384 TaxID=3373606 RepID=UPI00375539CD